MRYVSKPQTVEAIQWDGLASTAANMADAGMPVQVDPEVGDLHRLTLLAGKSGAQGVVPVPRGHWIVRQPDDLSDHWPVDDDYFQTKYQPVEDAP
jgi:hypothetical protein